MRVTCACVKKVIESYNLQFLYMLISKLELVLLWLKTVVAAVIFLDGESEVVPDDIPLFPDDMFEN